MTGPELEALLRAFRATEDDEELEELADELMLADDPRAVASLDAIKRDRNELTPRREAAAWALREKLNAPTPREDELRADWASGDVVLQRDAILQMNHAQRDVLERVLDDRDHPLYADALSALTFGCDHPWAHARLIRALDDPSAEVRAIALSALFYCEPVAAIPKVIEAARASEPDVAIGAIETLAYFASLSAVAAVAQLRAETTGDVQKAAQRAFDDLRSAFVDELREGGPSLRAWVQPVWSVLALTDEEIAPRPSGVPEPKPSRPIDAWLTSFAAFRDRFGTLGLSRDDIQPLYGIDWRVVPEPERASIGELLLRSPEARLRAHGAAACADWLDNRSSALLDDPCISVRKMAMWCLGRLPPREDLAALAWARFPAQHGWPAREALEAAVALSTPSDAVPKARAIAADDRYEQSVRVYAIEHLGKASDRDGITALLPLLEGPPAGTWSIHIAILRGVSALALESPIPERLRDVDDLYVQAALSRLPTKTVGDRT